MAIPGTYTVHVLNQAEQVFLLSLPIDGRHMSWLLRNTPAAHLVAIERPRKPGLAKHERLWDSGQVTFADSPEESYRRGCLKFELIGRRLRGGFVLVRETKKRGDWMLRKLVDAHPSAETSASGDVLWPEADVSRRELTRYYSRIYPYVSAYWADRPVTMLRAPEGVSGGLFFESSSRLISSPADLRRCGSRSAVELHAASYRIDQPEQPDWLVLDFDPPPLASLSTLLSVAEGAERLLRELELSFVWKMSGHRGLHVLVPLERKYETVSVFDFAKLLAETIHELTPRSSTIKVPNHVESSRVLVDYHRNHYHQSIIAPFSPRATTRPSLSLPVAWSEIETWDSLPRFELDVDERRLKKSGALLSRALEHPNDLDGAVAQLTSRFADVLQRA